ncbi:phosphate/phosphite/phosphonate ABC transporter substrate-binding protein [Vibrio sp. HN007]|uniref:phosphate/phosphite/phosphonate ABC transporter substrate-binding protein n=1 Tax=Vibrio iocasae TaxID=3098914 RepID=UPI0035D4B7E4
MEQNYRIRVFNGTHTKLVTLSILFLLSTIISAPLFAHHKPSEDKLVIGIISSKAKKHIKNTTPLANYLAGKLKDQGIKTAEVWVHNSPQQMGQWLQAGHVDLVSETIFSGLTLQQEHGASIELLRWKKQVDSYNSIIFAHQDSGINNLDDLIGKVIAFEDKGSTSGYYVPAAILLNHGYQLHKLRSVQDQVEAGKIGYVFIEDQLKSSSEVSVSAWVYRKQVEAGVFSNTDWNDAAVVPESYKNKLKIVHTSIPIPRSVVLFSPKMTAERKQKLIGALLNADKTDDGKQALAAFQDTKKFELFDSNGPALKPIMELQKTVKQSLN